MRFILLLALLLPPFHALAIDPGTVKGTLQIGSSTVPLKFAAAHLHDNAEKLLDRPKELRILVADREVPQEALAGIAFPPVMQLAREGKVKGLLLRVDPGDRNQVLITVLSAPAKAGESLVNQTLGGSRTPFKKLDIGNNRVIGEIEYRDTSTIASDMPRVSYAIQFSAPVFNEPAVTADLKGKEAQDSPQARVVRDKARAMAKADFAGVKKLSTERANRSTDQFLAQAGPQAGAYAKEAAADLEKSLKGLQRVVVRGDRAVAIFSDKEWMNFARVGGQWLSDD